MSCNQLFIDGGLGYCSGFLCGCQRALKEYDKDKKITMPSEEQFLERIDIIKYNNQTGYTVDIDVFLDNELSDLTMQVELLHNGKVTIEDLHVL